MINSFKSYHPVINFYYFFMVILFSMFFMHPVFLGISLVGSITYSMLLNGRRAVKFNFLYMIPMLLLIALINPIFSHEGATVLFYFQDTSITLESLLYGIAAAVMFVSVIIWFSCYNSVMTSDKFIYLFGKAIPSLSLIFSMVLRFIPMLKERTKVIAHAQKCMGRDVSHGSVLQRARNGIHIVSILTTWSLENAIETADSMRSRGYGLKGRTNFSIYRFDRRDRAALAVLILLFLLVCIGAFFGENTIQYFPTIEMPDYRPFGFLIYFAYGGLCFFPVILQIGEMWKWRKIRSIPSKN